MDKDFLIQAGVPEDKVEGIIAEHSKEVSGIVTAASSVIKLEVQKEDGESDAQYLARRIKLDKDDAVKGAYSNLSGAIKEVYGIEKKDGERESDYLKRASKEKSLETENNLKDEIKTLNDKIKAGVKDPELIKERDELKNLLEEERQGRIKDKEDWELAETKKSKISMLKSALPSFNDTLPKKTINLSVQSEIDELMAIEGVEIFKDEKDEISIRYGADQKYKTVKVSEIFAEKFKGLIKEESKGGAGSAGDKGGAGSKVLDIKDDAAPHEVNKEIQRHVTDNLKIPFGSLEYYAKFKELKTEISKKG